ncbi:MAG: hypothetical protein ABEJ75_04235 [Candidatus Nanohaloarchaea archaeon]
MRSHRAAVSANRYLILVIVGAIAALLMMKLMGSTISSTLDNALQIAGN